MWTLSYTSSYMTSSERPGSAVHPTSGGTSHTMSDRYQGFVSTPIGKLLVKNLGLPSPTRLERYTEGAPLVSGGVRPAAMPVMSN